MGSEMTKNESNRPCRFELFRAWIGTFLESDFDRPRRLPLFRCCATCKVDCWPCPVLEYGPTGGTNE